MGNKDAYDAGKTAKQATKVKDSPVTTAGKWAFETVKDILIFVGGVFTGNKLAKRKMKRGGYY
jgi:hypothetical protein